jgi:hypothetical protein
VIVLDVSSNKHLQLQEALKSLFISAMISSKHCQEALFSKDGHKLPDVTLALLNDSVSSVNTMHAIYITFFDELQHQEFDEFFVLFDTYKCEILNNFRTNHSHQWSSIQYVKMFDWARELGSLLGVTDSEYLKAKCD